MIDVICQLFGSIFFASILIIGTFLLCLPCRSKKMKYVDRIIDQLKLNRIIWLRILSIFCLVLLYTILTAESSRFYKNNQHHNGNSSNSNDDRHKSKFYSIYNHLISHTIKMVLIIVVLLSLSVELTLVRDYYSATRRKIIFVTLTISLIMTLIIPYWWSNIILSYIWFVIGYCIQYVGFFNYWYHVQGDLRTIKIHFVHQIVIYNVYQIYFLLILIFPHSFTVISQLILLGINLFTFLISIIILILIVWQVYKQDYSEQDAIISPSFSRSSSTKVLRHEQVH